MPPPLIGFDYNWVPNTSPALSPQEEVDKCLHISYMLQCMKTHISSESSLMTQTTSSPLSAAPAIIQGSSPEMRQLVIVKGFKTHAGYG